MQQIKLRTSGRKNIPCVAVGQVLNFSHKYKEILHKKHIKILKNKYLFLKNRKNYQIVKN